MQTHAPAARRADFNVGLNGYRGLCALVVFVYHLGSSGILPWPSGSPVADGVTYLWNALAYGVEMFFMISGFVILGSLLRHPTVGGFLKDRFVRIFSAWVPALIALTVVSITFAIKPFDEAGPVEAAGLFFGNLLLLPPIAPFPMVHRGSWSLSYEWVFYLLAAAGVLLYRRVPPRNWAIALWTAAAAGFICLFPRSLFFVTGVLVFKYRDWFAQHLRWLRFPLLSFLLFLIAWRYTGVMKAHLTITMVDFLADGRWIAVLLALLASIHMFASICLDGSRQTAFLRGPTFQFLGNISYSFYLWHTLAMGFVKRLVVPYVVPHYGEVVGLIVFGAASLAIALPVSWASWKLFEGRLAKSARRALASQSNMGRELRATT